MATKKSSAPRKSATSRPIRKEALSLEVVTKNQREINGSVYEALELILACIGAATLRSGDRAKLAKAKAIIEAVPGYDPPGCGAGPYP